MPPRPTEISDLNCIDLTRRIAKHSTMTSGCRKCRVAQIISLGGSSQGMTLAKRQVTPKSSSNPIVWFPVRVPSHIFSKTYVSIQSDAQVPTRATPKTTSVHVLPMNDWYENTGTGVLSEVVEPEVTRSSRLTIWVVLPTAD